MQMMARRRQPSRDYGRRAVFIDWLGRFVWYVDSRGRRSENYTVMPGERPEDVASALESWLDQVDPIPSDEFSPPPLGGRSHLRLI